MSGSTITRRKIAIGLGAALLLGTRAASAQQSPKAFLDAIYQAYRGKDSKGIPLDGEGTIRAYFAPPLADAMVKDRQEADKRGDVPLLDGDPFIDAQDWDIANLSVNVKTSGAAAATGTVTFTNLGKRTRITLDLVRTAAGWRIADITAPSGSLRKLYKLR